MNHAPRTTHQDTDLPEDVVLSVRHVSKKFCRNLRRSMLYGMQDLGRNLLGLRPKAEIRDSLLDAGNPTPQSPLIMPPHLPISNNQSPITNNYASPLPNNQSPITNSHSPHSPPNLQSPITKTSPPPLRRDEFWALQDINFDVKRGEAVGIIGLNGSGKTTLFRVIHGLFPPDQGEVVVRGRIGALIALGAGFHPHLTGRENIFLNGAILGIPQGEIRARLEEIVEFAEIGDFIDAPVSTYSSGMRVRLGFAVAINMNPDILLIDEVLAVGDLPFKNKCVKHMRKLQGSGRTILFVSHNMYWVEHVCQRTILLDHGGIVQDGPSPVVIGEYYRRTSLQNLPQALNGGDIVHVYESGRARYLDARIRDTDGNVVTAVKSGDTARIEIDIKVMQRVRQPWLLVTFRADQDIQSNVAFCAHQTTEDWTTGVRTVTLDISSLPLQGGTYILGGRITECDRVVKIAGTDDLLHFVVVPQEQQILKNNTMGFVELIADWPK